VVIVCIRSEVANEDHKDLVELTELFFKASDRYWAPLSPIAFSLRLRVVTVCAGNQRYQKDK